jgi:hypothetical protein
MLSPFPGMDPYLERHWVNLVEIDLTRDGNRALLVPVLELPAEKRTTYLACVFRAAWKKYGRKEAYPISLRAPLPAIGIPLRAQDQDVRLDLQSLVDEAYQAGRYDRTIDYGQPCVPPLTPEDAAWAAHLVANHGSAA